MDVPSIFHKSNLLELFSQATFPQCYIIECRTLHICVRSDGLDFSSNQQTGTTCNGINYWHSTLGLEPHEIFLLSLPNRIFWILFSQATFPQCYIIQCKTLHIWVRSDGLDFLPINKPEPLATESTIGIYPRTGNAQIILLSLPNRIFWNFSHKPFFYNTIPYSVRHSIIGSDPMVWIFFLSTNRNYLQRNQLSAPTLGPETLTQLLLSLPKSNLLELFSQATFPQCYITQCRTLKKWFSSDGLDFFPINKPELLATESTIGTYPRTGTAWIVPSIFLPNRIFWNFSHKPLFHNAISQSVRHSIYWVRSDGLDFFPINKPELLATESTIGTLPSDWNRMTYSFYLSQIESSGTFLTSHFSTMLYHIV